MDKHGDLTAIAQSLLEYIEDLLTASPKESFTTVEMLMLLNAVKNDRSLLDLLERHAQSLRSSRTFAWSVRAGLNIGAGHVCRAHAG
jgi:hypothetical protein